MVTSRQEPIRLHVASLSAVSDTNTATHYDTSSSACHISLLPWFCPHTLATWGPMLLEQRWQLCLCYARWYCCRIFCYLFFLLLARSHSISTAEHSEEHSLSLDSFCTSLYDQSMRFKPFFFFLLNFSFHQPFFLNDSSGWVMLSRLCHATLSQAFCTHGIMHWRRPKIIYEVC